MICGLSGGVDSSVAAVLIHEAIGDQLTCIFVDTGLMRAGEGDEGLKDFGDHGGVGALKVGGEPAPAAAQRGRRRTR